MGLMDLFSGSGAKGLRKPKSIRHGGKRLSEILEAHAKFHRGLPGGVRADLTEADLHFADLSHANLTGALLERANLEGANFKQAKLMRANLSGANLRGADLRNTDMTEAVLPGANLTEAQASGIEFFRCDLSGACLERANLRNTNFRGTNIKGARFTGADMGVTILRETDLEGVDLSGVDLTTTLMPRGYNRRVAGSSSQTEDNSAASHRTGLQQINYFPVMCATGSGGRSAGTAAARFDAQPLDLLIEGRERNLKPLGSFGLIPVGAFQHVHDHAPLDLFHDLKQRWRRLSARDARRARPATSGRNSASCSRLTAATSWCARFPEASRRPSVPAWRAPRARSTTFSSSRTLPGQS